MEVTKLYMFAVNSSLGARPLQPTPLSVPLTSYMSKKRNFTENYEHTPLSKARHMQYMYIKHIYIYIILKLYESGVSTKLDLHVHLIYIIHSICEGGMKNSRHAC